MSRLRKIITTAAILVLGLAPILHAQQGGGGGPQVCPPLDRLQSPTLLDVLLYPGFSTG